MFRFLLVVSFLLNAGLAVASPLDHTMSMKDRIRLSLWFDGIETKTKMKPSDSIKRTLPEEIERPLRKL